MDKIDHLGIPVNKTIDGLKPARIGDKICHHDTCKKLFNSENNLVDHLKENKCYKYYYTRSHEDTLEYLIKLSDSSENHNLPQYHCPSILCTLKFSTMEELKNHYRSFGIKI